MLRIGKQGNLRENAFAVGSEVFAIVLGLLIAFQAEDFRRQQDFDAASEAIWKGVLDELNTVHSQLQDDTGELTQLSNRLHRVLIATSEADSVTKERDFGLRRSLLPQGAWEIALSSQHAAELMKNDDRLLSLVSRAYELRGTYEQLHNKLLFAHSDLSAYLITSNQHPITNKNLVFPVYSSLRTLLDVHKDLIDQIAIVLEEDWSDYTGS